jgi:hypothetical protein
MREVLFTREENIFISVFHLFFLLFYEVSAYFKVRAKERKEERVREVEGEREQEKGVRRKREK